MKPYDYEHSFYDTSAILDASISNNFVGFCKQTVYIKAVYG